MHRKQHQYFNKITIHAAFACAGFGVEHDYISPVSAGNDWEMSCSNRKIGLVIPSARVFFSLLYEVLSLLEH